MRCMHFAIALLCVFAMEKKLIAQKQFSFYGGTTIPFTQVVHPQPHLDSLEALRGLSTGKQGNLTTKTHRYPLLSMGCLFKRNLRKAPELGFNFGVEVNTRYETNQIMQDEGYYQYYRWWGYYPNSDKHGQVVTNFFTDIGMHYRVRKLVVQAGISGILFDMYIGSNSFFINLFADKLIHLRFSFDLNYKLSLYCDYRTSLNKPYYTKIHCVGAGVQYNLEEKNLKRKKR